jgi:hypothetical protein
MAWTEQSKHFAGVDGDSESVYRGLLGEASG